jgi:hypothetical protein
MLLNDMEEFLRSKDWYTWGGVPHRRGFGLFWRSVMMKLIGFCTGYLLYGEPGTGKSESF